MEGPSLKIVVVIFLRIWDFPLDWYLTLSITWRLKHSNFLITIIYADRQILRLHQKQLRTELHNKQITLDSLQQCFVESWLCLQSTLSTKCFRTENKRRSRVYYYIQASKKGPLWILSKFTFLSTGQNLLCTLLKGTFIIQQFRPERPNWRDFR